MRTDPLWKRALDEPLPKRPGLELLDKFRTELFRRLEIFTDFPGADELDYPWLDQNIQRVADRLKLIARKMQQAALRALRAGTHEMDPDHRRCPLCHHELPDSSEYDDLLRCVDCGAAHRISEWGDNASNCPNCDSGRAVLDKQRPASPHPVLELAKKSSSTSTAAEPATPSRKGRRQR
jgi:hypothetical protein